MSNIPDGGIWSPKGKQSGVRRGGRMRQGNGLTAAGAYGTPEPLPATEAQGDRVNKGQAAAILKDMGISNKKDQDSILAEITNFGSKTTYEFDRKELVYQAQLFQRSQEAENPSEEVTEADDGPEAEDV